MVVHHGTRPTKLHRTDFSAARTFGAAQPHLLPDNFSIDIGKTMPNQDVDGLFNGCTGYTQTDNENDVDDAIYKPPYTYSKTCLIESHDETTGCDIRDSFKATQVYGFQRIDETTDQEAEQHRGGQYFNVYSDGNLDWFDAIRSACYLNKKGVSCGTPWFPTFEQVNSTGMLSMPPVLELKNPQVWHNWSCKGWVTINGFAYLLVKSWQGNTYGDKGWAYMSREVANAIFEIYGSAAFIQVKSDPNNIQLIKIPILETILNFLYRLIGLSRLN